MVQPGFGAEELFELARRAPAEAQDAVERPLKIFDLHRKHLAFVQGDLRAPVARRGNVPIVHHEFAVEPQAKAVITLQANFIFAIFGRGDSAFPTTGEVVEARQTARGIGQRRAGPGIFDLRVHGLTGGFLVGGQQANNMTCPQCPAIPQPTCLQPTCLR
jgi:hypothetical protein